VKPDDFTGQEAVVRALASLLNGNPDPLDQGGFSLIKRALHSSSSNDILTKSTLELVLFCCVRHEQNRQNLVNILNSLSCKNIDVEEYVQIWSVILCKISN